MLRPSDAVTMLEPALEEFADLDEDLVAQLQVSLATAYLNAQQPEKILGLLDAAMETFEHRGDLPGLTAL